MNIQRLIVFLFLAGVLVLSTSGFIIYEARALSFNVTLAANPNIAMSSNSNLFSDVTQRRLWYAGGRWWLFSSDPSNIQQVTSSSDGISWTALASSGASCGGGSLMTEQAIWYDGTYFYAVCTGCNCFHFDVGTIAGTTISWTSDTISTPFQIHTPSVSVDTNGHPWVTFGNSTGLYVYTSTSTGTGSWSTAAGFPKGPYGTGYTGSGSYATGFMSGTILPLTGGKMAIVYSSTSFKLAVRIWSGSSFGSEAIMSTHAPDSDGLYSAIAVNDNVHIAVVNSGNVYHSVYTSSMSSEFTISNPSNTTASGNQGVPTLSYDSSIGDVFALSSLLVSTGCCSNSSWVLHQAYYNGTSWTTFSPLFRIDRSSGTNSQTEIASVNPAVQVTGSSRVGILTASVAGCSKFRCYQFSQMASTPYSGSPPSSGGGGGGPTGRTTSYTDIQAFSIFLPEGSGSFKRNVTITFPHINSLATGGSPYPLTVSNVFIPPDSNLSSWIRLTNFPSTFTGNSLNVTAYFNFVKFPYGVYSVPVKAVMSQSSTDVLATGSFQLTYGTNTGIGFTVLYQSVSAFVSQNILFVVGTVLAIGSFFVWNSVRRKP